MSVKHVRDRYAIPVKGEGFYVVLYGASWGQPIPELPTHSRVDKHVLVCHKYVWLDGHAFPGVKEEDHVRNLNVGGFDAAVFGDNHKPFTYRTDGCNVLNGGAFMRRRADEATHRPFVGLLTATCEWRKHYLDISQDRTLDPAAAVKDNGDEFSLQGFMQMLNELGDSALDFQEAVKQIMDRRGVPADVRKIILKCMGGVAS